MLRHLKPTVDPRALVGTETSDDAAVYRLSDTEAIVETVDFFTPVVDDPYWFGRIAAANAFSDVWAMGGRPLFALNLVAWPVATLPMDQLGEVLRGGADTAALAGASILGGHSIDDPEPKYGLAVTGLVHPDRILRNVGARPGDRLLLTKPLGTGVATTAIKRGVAPLELVERVVALMATLNRVAGEISPRAGASTPSPTSPASGSWATPGRWPRAPACRSASGPARSPSSRGSARSPSRGSSRAARRPTSPG